MRFIFGKIEASFFIIISFNFNFIINFNCIVNFKTVPIIAIGTINFLARLFVNIIFIIATVFVIKPA